MEGFVLRVAICDDEIGFTTKIEDIILRVSRANGIKVEVSVFFDGITLLNDYMHNNARYDLVFLDIEMKQMDGLETARKIREMDELVYLIYVTSYSSYALEAYEVHPFQFLVKPIEEDLVIKYYMMIHSKIISDAIFYDYKYKKDYYKVWVSDIMYFESDRRVINIVLSDGSKRVYYDKLSKVEERLGKQRIDFWRIHRSLLVNVKYIVKKAYDYVVLSDGTVFYISEDRRKDLNERYATMIEKEME